MRQAGVPDQFNPYVQLIEETFKRFDERIDIAKFLPPMPQDIQNHMMQNMQLLCITYEDEEGTPLTNTF